MSQFKQYDNKSSMLKRYSRQTQGGDTDIFEKRLGWWERRTDIPKSQIDDIEFTVSLNTEFRADLISYEIYGRSDLDWLVLMYNNIVDINEELTVGKILTLPSVERTLYSIVTRPTNRRVFNVNT